MSEARVCRGCKKERNVWTYPSVVTTDGATWHLYCYHTQAGTNWIMATGSGGGAQRTLSTEEVDAHIEWAKANYEEPK